MRTILSALIGLLLPPLGMAQSVPVDVNLNMEHSVGGVSDFGRERHMVVHAALSEPDWIGEQDKMDYLLDDLDVYLGRDNGAAGPAARNGRRGL